VLAIAVTMPSMGQTAASDFERDVKLEALVPVVLRANSPALVSPIVSRRSVTTPSSIAKTKTPHILAGGSEAYKVNICFAQGCSPSFSVRFSPNLEWMK